MHKDKDCLQSFEEFVRHLNPTAKLDFHSLFNGLCKQRGWGEKTSALFTKTVFHVHSDTYGNELKLWDDAPTMIGTDDTVYLPVDAVILAIFNRIDNSKAWNFHNINQKLSAEYSNTDIVIWDDLWFWGFITQKSTGSGRLFEWNENKYWILRESDKNPHKIDEIRKKAAEFLYILGTDEVV